MMNELLRFVNLKKSSQFLIDHYQLNNFKRISLKVTTFKLQSFLLSKNLNRIVVMPNTVSGHSFLLLEEEIIKPSKNRFEFK